MSFLAIEKPKLPINSLEELVENPDYTTDVYHGSALDLLQVHTNGSNDEALHGGPLFPASFKIMHSLLPMFSFFGGGGLQ